MEKKNKVIEEVQEEILKKNVKLIQSKGDDWKDPLDKMMIASYDLGVKSFEQELEREKRINSSVNINLVILGFLVTAYITAFVTNKNNNARICMLVGIIVLVLNLGFLLISFTYRRHMQMSSPCKIANNFLETYINDENLDEFNKDKGALKEANFIFSMQPDYLDLSKINNKSILLLRISNFLTIITSILLVVALFLLEI